jgi:hypothetical protein
LIDTKDKKRTNIPFLEEFVEKVEENKIFIKDKGLI